MMTWWRENWRLYRIRCEIWSEINGIVNVTSFWVSSWDRGLLVPYLSLINKTFLVAKTVRLVMNRAAALHNICVLCLVIAAYVINTYRQPARLFTKKKKKEDRVSGRNTTGRSPCHGSLRLRHSAFNFESKASSSVKQCWFADDASGPGSTTEIKKL